MAIKYAGADWIKSVIQRKGQTISPLGEEVADLLGQLFRGIYHEGTQASKVDWAHPRHIQIVINHFSFCTYDADLLTRLVVLCHDTRLRCELKAAAPGWLRLVFYKRTQRDGSIFERHPTIEEAIKIARDQTHTKGARYE